MLGGLGGLLLSYAAGALSILSPCVLPLLPIVLFGVLQESVWGPLAMAAGLSVSFAAVGIFVATIGFAIGFDPSTFRIGVAALTLIFGAILLVPSLQDKFATIAGPITNGGQSLLDRIKPSGIRGQFILGVLLGAIWSPCSGPTLGAAIALAAQSETAAKASIIMAAFGLGAATPVLALAYGSRRAIFARRDWLSRLARIGKPVMGSALVALGIFVLTGFDKIVETALTRAMPDWLVGMTTRL